jgi:hypothetical protein
MVDPPVDFDALFAHDNLKSHAENTPALISTPDAGPNVSRFTLQPKIIWGWSAVQTGASYLLMN